MRLNKAFILAAGLGTRLRPFTNDNPKALVTVGGVPMLERVIMRLKEEGFDDLVINVHHFADKIEDFVKAHNNFGVRIRFSDERELLRDTGGGILHAMEMLAESNEPFLIHNVDILSNAPLAEFMCRHSAEGNDATLLVSNRDSSRRLIFDSEMNFKGWHKIGTEGVADEYKPIELEKRKEDKELAFSGIHIMSVENIRQRLVDASKKMGEKFSVIDFYLDSIGKLNIRGVEGKDLRLIDIGKPATLSQANGLFER